MLPALDGDDAADAKSRLDRAALTAAEPISLRALTGLRYAGQLGIVENVAADREARVTVRRHAIEQIGLAAHASSEAVLADLLRDTGVAEAAVDALGRVLGGDRTRVSLHALGSPHVAISANAARFLAGAGDAATLVERLGSVNDAEVRRLLR